MGDCAIHLAARRGDNDLVKLFIEAGTKVDTQNVSKLEDFFNLKIESMGKSKDLDKIEDIYKYHFKFA